MSSVAAPAIPTEASSRARLRPLLLLRRAAGLALAMFAVVPLFRLLPGRETGLAGEVVASVLEIYFDYLGSGALMVLLGALLAGLLMPDERTERLVARLRTLLLLPRLPVFAAALAVVAGSASAAFTLFVLEGKASNIDAMVQLLHARYWAAGQLAGPADGLNEFWFIQNSVITEKGWVSQYPPGQVALFALAFRIGAPWLVGPLLAGVTVFFTTLAAGRLIPERPATARMIGVLLAFSTYFACLAGSFLNHVVSAACFAVALYCGVRARDDRASFAIGTGAAISYAFAVRPLSAIVTGVTFAMLLWVPALSRTGIVSCFRRGSLAAIGALPIVVALLAYNAHFFSHPLTLGYRVALGPAMSLGFHRDPWGNMYGPVEALAYTGADLMALGINLFETPLSATLLIGAWLVISGPLPPGARVFFGWALGAVLANALYWHHGLYMGPRMLLESAPAWAALAAFATTGLYSLVPEKPVLGRFELRSGLAGAFALSLMLGLAYLGPGRARSYGGDFIPMARIEPPRPVGSSLVFVHDAWLSRIGMRMAAAGVPLDSVEMAITQNPTCSAHLTAMRITAEPSADRSQLFGGLDMEPRESRQLKEVAISPGNVIRVTTGETLTGECMREAQADLNGILDVAPFIWQGDLPGVTGNGTLYIRDLGPEANQAALARWPDRTPWVFMVPAPDAPPVLVEYDEAMRRLWHPKERA